MVGVQEDDAVTAGHAGGLGFSMVEGSMPTERADSKESACSAADLASIPVWGRSPGGGHGNPLQYSCLENPHGVLALESREGTRASRRVEEGLSRSLSLIYFFPTPYPYTCFSVPVLWHYTGTHGGSK